MHGGNVWQSYEPGHWLDFSANLRPGGPPDWVREALSRGLKTARYYPDPDMKRAVRGLAAFLDVDEACVLPAAGGVSAIDLVTALGNGPVTVLSPCFGEYARSARRHNRPLESICLLSGLDPSREPLSPSAALSGRVPKNGTVWLANPMNPLGAAFQPEETEALADMAEAVGSVLAVDEAFVEYCPAYSVRRKAAGRINLIVVGSMTKILGIPGVRLGYVCAHPDVISRLRYIQLPWEVSAFASEVAAALPLHRAEIRQDAEENARRREALKTALERLGIFVYPSRASFLLADLGRDAAPIALALREDGILVRTCEDFDLPHRQRHIRLAVKDEGSNRTLIQALERALSHG